MIKLIAPIMLSALLILVNPKPFTVEPIISQQPILLPIIKEEIIKPVSRGQQIREEEFIVTGYTAGYESTQKRPGQKGYGITATGTKVTEGRTIAADWKVLPPGTKVEIQGLPGILVVEDKGGAVKGNHIDVYFSSLKQARSWGLKRLKVKILEEEK